MPTLLAFDLDGTLIQSEALKAESYGWAAQQLRPDLAPDDVAHAYGPLVGNSRETITRTLLGQFDLAEAARQHAVGMEPWRTFVGIRLERYRAMLTDRDLVRRNVWPEALALARMARDVSDQTALVTTSERWAVDLVLDALDLHDAFDTIVTADDVPNVKPDPAGYRLALDRLVAAASTTVAIEDSPSGVRAALAANVHVLAVPTHYTREPIGAMVRTGEVQATSVVEAARLSEAVRGCLRGV